MLGMQEFGPKIIFQVAGVEITETVVVTWILMALIMIFVSFATRRKDKVPYGIQNFMEFLVETLNNLVDTTMGSHAKAYRSYMSTLIIFIALANISGLFGLRPPTADANTTMALSVMTFIMIQYAGIKNRKLGYVKGFFEPFFLMFPMNVIGELANPISLGFRLFGNIVGGLVIMSLLYGALGYIAILPLPALFHVYFDLFSGLLQSFIFMMLSMVLVSMAIE